MKLETELVIERGVDGVPTADHAQRFAFAQAYPARPVRDAQTRLLAKVFVRFSLFCCFA
jgi:hypothetical protein